MASKMVDPNEGEPRKVTTRWSCTMADVPTPVVFSWSAGKDSAFGLWTLLRDPDFEVRALLTTLTEDYDRVSMSGVRDALLDLQAEAIGLPVIKVWIPPQCPNEVYEKPDGLDVRLWGAFIRFTLVSRAFGPWL